MKSKKLCAGFMDLEKVRVEWDGERGQLLNDVKDFYRGANA